MLQAPKKDEVNFFKNVLSCDKTRFAFWFLLPWGPTGATSLGGEPQRVARTPRSLPKRQ